MFGLASNMDSSDARASKTDTNPKHFLFNSSHQHGKEYMDCGSEGVERDEMTLVCYKSPKYIITKVNFADYGNPTGCEDNKASKHGNCSALATLRLVKNVRK